MNLFKRMVILVGLVLTLTFPLPVWVLAQTVTNDGTTLQKIIIFGRHSIRSSTTCPTTLSQYAVDPFPSFSVYPGCLTPNGMAAETLLGAYYRLYLLQEKLLTGNNQTDVPRAYFRANSIERSNVTAEMFQAGLLPGSQPAVHSYPVSLTTPVFDPVFDPIATGVANVDPSIAATQAQEIFNSQAGSASAVQSAYSGEYALIRSALFDYLLGTQPPPTPPYCPQSQSSTACVDPTAQAIIIAPNTTPPLYTGAVINTGGLETMLNATDPFVMQYADNSFAFPDDVAWGRLTADQISQQTRLTNLHFQIEMRLPYLARVQSSNAASHILRTMKQTAFPGSTSVGGAFGNANSRVVVVISSDAYVAGLAGLLNLHWQLPGYQPDFCAPGGALVFELRQSSTGSIVRVFYTAQTFEQLRNLTLLTLDQPPATVQLLVPGGSKSATDLDVDFSVFQNLMTNAIGPAYVQNPLTEVPPGVLTTVTCQNPCPP
jgi:4-phytase/acid phosphatase